MEILIGQYLENLFHSLARRTNRRMQKEIEHSLQKTMFQYSNNLGLLVLSDLIKRLMRKIDSLEMVSNTKTYISLMGLYQEMIKF